MQLIDELEKTIRIQKSILADYKYERLLLTIGMSGEIEGLTEADIPQEWFEKRLRMIDLCVAGHQEKLEEAQTLLAQIQKAVA